MAGNVVVRQSGSVLVRIGTEWFGSQGTARSVLDGHGKARRVMAVMVRRGKLRRGLVGQSWRVTASFGRARRVLAVMVRRGWLRPVTAGSVADWQSWIGSSSNGVAGSGAFWQSRLVSVCQRTACCGWAV